MLVLPHKSFFFSHIVESLRNVYQHNEYNSRFEVVKSDNGDDNNDVSFPDNTDKNWEDKNEGDCEGGDDNVSYGHENEKGESEDNYYDNDE
ncbi:Hypothetical predicted protein [Octopus vulgaris]|uniref:Uncharacterized protein n=1 Tax=Octopus vulgaris TaxID=6645 RepID=A0AA36EVS2_OCTVU|nr:Hypothetical predicted protein [Octopus vulgaris]